MAGNKLKLTYDEILLKDEFLAYTHKPTKDIIEYWEKIFENDAEVRIEFDKALKLHNLLSSVKKPLNNPLFKEKILNQILQKIDKEENASKSQKARVLNQSLKIAATILLIVGLGYLFSLVFNKQGTSDNIISYNEVIVPSGEKTQVILPDGTKIWLNSESKLKYPSVFTKGERNVYLEGEAYFDVSKIKKSKFLVNTQGIKIEVLGTIFNVKSYPDEETIETSVVEGKVKVDAGTQDNPIEPVYILPSERSIFYKNFRKFTTKEKSVRIPKKEIILEPKSPITVSEVNIQNIISWKDHLLVFDNETFEEIAVKMARWYKIKVLINDEGLKKQRFTGKFVNNETFYQVLEAINITTPIEYKYDKDELQVSPKRYQRVTTQKKRPKIS